MDYTLALHMWGYPNGTQILYSLGAASPNSNPVGPKLHSASGSNTGPLHALSHEDAAYSSGVSRAGPCFDTLRVQVPNNHIFTPNL